MPLFFHRFERNVHWDIETLHFKTSMDFPFQFFFKRWGRIEHHILWVYRPGLLKADILEIWQLAVNKKLTWYFIHGIKPMLYSQDIKEVNCSILKPVFNGKIGYREIRRENGKRELILRNWIYLLVRMMDSVFSLTLAKPEYHSMTLD